MNETTSVRIVDSLLKESGAVTKKGGYSYVNGSLIANALSKVPSKAIRAGRIVRPGTGMTEKFVGGIDPKAINSITVQLQTNVGVHTRTIMQDSQRRGTPGNDGLINLSPNIIPSTTPFEILLYQIDDQPLFFPQMQLESMLYDEVVETTANYFDNSVNGMDSYHIAKALSYAFHRGALNGNANLVEVDSAKVYDDVYMIKKVNEINSYMANGDKVTQLMTFTGPREIAARPELINWLKTPKSGYILNSDISTKLLMSENFDSTLAERYGTQYRGNFGGGYDLMEAPQGIWSLVENWLGLDAGALDKVYGVVFTPSAYASGGYGKNEMKALQSTSHDGVIAFPFIKYGGSAYRLMYVIVDSSFVVPEKLKSKIAPAPVIAPRSFGSEFEPISRTIYDENGTPIGSDIIANVLKPNGSDFSDCRVTITVGDGTNLIPTAVISAKVGEKPLPVTNNADGTQVILVPTGSAPNITINATGFAEQTISLTAVNTKKATFEKKVTMTV